MVAAVGLGTGGRRLIDIRQGDCLELLRTLPDGSVDAVVTDPPFKVSQEYSANADPDNLIAVSCIWDAAGQMWRVTKDGGVCVMFYDTRILPLAIHTMQRAGWKYLRALTFYRRWGQASLVQGWMSTSDFILVFAKPGRKPKFYGSPKHDVYVRTAPEPESVNHPAQKPMDALRHLVARVCPPDGTVLDPFGGSGTTAVACLMEGRSCILMEREPAYVEIARRRVAEAETPP